MYVPVRDMFVQRQLPRQLGHDMSMVVAVIDARAFDMVVFVIVYAARAVLPPTYTTYDSHQSQNTNRTYKGIRNMRCSIINDVISNNRSVRHTINRTVITMCIRKGNLHSDIRNIRRTMN